MNIEDEMERRIENGEFGNPPNISEIVKETEKLTRKNRNRFVTMTGLWANDKSEKIAFEGRTGEEDLTVLARSKIIAFYREKTGDNQPDLNLVFVENED